MIDVLRSEWIKITTVRVNYVLCIIAAAFPILIIVLIAALTSDPQDVADDLVGAVTGTMLVTALILGVVGGLNLTTEFTHNTIRTSFAAVPQRGKVLGAKLIVSVVFCAAFAALTEIVTYNLGAIILNSRDAPVERTGTDTAAMLGLVGLVALLVMLSYGLALIIRNSPATITTFILWPLLLESIARGVLSAAGVDNPTSWLPYQSAFRMANPDPDPTDPGRLRAGLLLALVVVALTVIGSIVNERRDA